MRRGVAREVALFLATRGATPTAMLAYTLLADFESTAGATPASSVTVTADTSSRKALHTAGMKVTGNGTNSSQSVSALGTAGDLSATDTIVACVDCGSAARSAVTSVRPRFVAGANSYTYQVNAAAGVVQDAPFDTFSRGKRWVAFKVANFRITNWAGAAVTAESASKRIDMVINAGGANNTDIVMDALVAPAKHKSAVMITFDDNNPTQYTNAYPALAARGMVASLYVPWAWIGLNGKTTLAQLHEMQAAGWAICLDGTPDDQPFTYYATRAAALAQLNSNRDSVAAEFGSFGTAHFCFPNGRVGYAEGAITSACTADGSTTVTLTGGANAFNNGIAPGIFVTSSVGAAVPAGTYVTAIGSTGTTVTFNNAIPAGVTSITCTASLTALTPTCNGTTTVTLASTTNLHVGMTMLGYTVPANTKIVSIDSGTQLTVSNAVPATCVKADFCYLDGEWWATRFYDDLIAAGYKSGRRVNGNIFLWAGFGVDVLATIGMYGLSLDNTASTSSIVAQINAAIDQQQDMILYGHNPQAADMSSHWNVIFDAIKARVDAGDAEVVTVPVGIETALARPGIA